MKHPRFHAGLRGALAAFLLVAPVCAATQAEDAARQAAALFVASCVRFTGNEAGLRAWATDTKIPELPAPGQEGFLKGALGKVFDASNPAGSFVIVSRDDGGCSVLARAVESTVLLDAVEAALRAASFGVFLAGQWDDAVDEKIRHRTYEVSFGARKWTVVVSQGQGVGQAMLTASAR